MKSITDRTTQTKISLEENIFDKLTLFIEVDRGYTMTKKGALNFAAFLREAAVKVTEWSKELK